MCNDGVNHAQLQMAIEMAEQQAALSAGWMKEIVHLAEHAGLAVDELRSAESALKTARRALEDSVDIVATRSRSSNYEVHSV